jgi:hypothetical protein
MNHVSNFLNQNFFIAKKLVDGFFRNAHFSRYIIHSDALETKSHEQIASFRHNFLSHLIGEILNLAQTYNGNFEYQNSFPVFTII